jgi:hypothetical protein
MKDIMNDLVKYKETGPAGRLKSVLFGQLEPSFSTNQSLSDFTPLNKGLNHSQIDAIRLALAANGTKGRYH